MAALVVGSLMAASPVDAADCDVVLRELSALQQEVVELKLENAALKALLRHASASDSRAVDVAVRPSYAGTVDDEYAEARALPILSPSSRQLLAGQPAPRRPP
jgi:hypothetical protein